MSEFVTSFDPEEDVSLTGNSALFEYWLPEGPVEACCEKAGRWQDALHFSRGDGTLFGFGKFKTIILFPLIREFMVRFGLEMGLVDPGEPSKATGSRLERHFLNALGLSR